MKNSKCIGTILNKYRHQAPSRDKNRRTSFCRFLVQLPLGEGWGEGLGALSFAPSPNPSQREGNIASHSPKECGKRRPSLETQHASSPRNRSQTTRTLVLCRHVRS